jgi:transposase
MEAAVARASVRCVWLASAPVNEPPVDLKTLHAKIGQLALENDFLSGALGKAGLLSARK